MTDTDALTEKIEEALWGVTQVYDTPHGHGTEVGVHAPVHKVVAAILPVVAEEVRAGAEEAYEQAKRDMRAYLASGNLNGDEYHAEPTNPYRKDEEKR